MIYALKIVLAVVVMTAVLIGCQQLRLADRAPLAPKAGNAMRLATWNVHYIIYTQAEGRWGISGWEARKTPMDTTFKALEADIVAFQEMETFFRGSEEGVNLTRAWLLQNNPAYGAAAIGDWRSFPSTQPILYRRARFEILDQGWFFFSDTPDVIYSRTFNGSFPAFASWVQFRDKQSSAVFRVVNVHLDFRSAQNRHKSIELVTSRITPWIAAGQTVFLAGDLNARMGSDLHTQVEATGMAFVPVDASTYHLDRGLNLFGAIDHLAYSGMASPAGPAAVFQTKTGDVWPSDHYPVTTDFNLHKPNGE